MAYLDENVFIEIGDPEPPEPQPLLGDLNLDGEVNIADLNILIDVILRGSDDADLLKRADINKDGEINIADVNALIEIILG